MYFTAGLLSSRDFMPHGYCYMWDRGLIWVHVVSDGLIALAYFSIPVTLVYFVRRKRDLPFHSVFLLFGLFIVACGSMHAMEVWNLWHSNYWLAGIIKGITAVASIVTAILLFRIVPQALALPSPEALQEVNRHLLDRTDEAARANAELACVNKALQRSQEQQRFLFDSIPHPVWVYEINTLAIKDVNLAAIASYGYTREEFLSLTIKDLRLDEEIAGLLESVRKMAGTATHSSNWRHRKKNGELINVEITSGAVMFDGRESRLVVATDITERKRIEEQLESKRSDLVRSNLELTAANKELEAFSYSVSHDLRAPLRSIDGFSLALLEDYEEKLDAEGKDNLHRVRAASQRMGVLIDDLLNLSRVTRSEMRLQRVDLSAIGRAVGAELKSIQPGRRVEFHVEDGLEASVDSHLMQIVLENLLGNAWKFTSKHESAKIEFGQTQSNGRRIYFVRDDGAGFDAVRAERLFGAFQRFHEKNDFPGTGVGLATVQRIIQRHGGHVWADSAVERGATFYFALMETNEGEPESWPKK